MNYLGDLIIKKLVHESEEAPHQIYNVGCGASVQLMDFIAALENCLGRKAKLDFLPTQKGEVLATEADVTKLESDFRLSTPGQGGGRDRAFCHLVPGVLRD